MKKYYLIFVCTFYILKGLAQSLEVGDKLPALHLTNVINAPSEVLNLPMHKYKLILLDFWATNCSGCVKKIPELNKLQAYFNDQIQIVMVTKQHKDTTQRFFNRFKKLNPDPSILQVTGDTILSRLFPHHAVPLHIWIDSSGIVQYIADGTISKETIEYFLTGKRLQLPPYNPEREERTSLFSEKFNNQLKYYSYFSTYVTGVKTGYSGGSDSNYLHYPNYPVSELYSIAYAENRKYPYYHPGRLLMEVCDSSRYFKPVNTAHYKEWKENNLYTYHLYLPQRNLEEKFRVMREDLERHFGLKANIEKRKVKCIVLVRSSDQNKLASKGGEPAKQFYSNRTKGENAPIRFLRNQPYSLFARVMSGSIMENYMVVFIDETGIDGNIDIVIPGEVMDMPDLNGIRKVLATYDLALVEEYRLMDVVVLRE